MDLYEIVKPAASKLPAGKNLKTNKNHFFYHQNKNNNANKNIGKWS